MRVLTCMGDATSIEAHGGLPYHLLDAGKRAGFLDLGWRLNLEKLRPMRAAWNMARVLGRRESGGFQYSETCLRALVRQVPQGLDNPDEIISIFPLLPGSRLSGTKLSFYIDATLAENFQDYGIGKKVGSSIVKDALDRERQAYADAVRVLCRSRAAARCVVDKYKVDAKKVHIVPGGANIIGAPEGDPRGSADPRLEPIRLGFIGKDWRRKNLARVLEIADVLHARDMSVEVIAAGFDAKCAPRHRLLKCAGFLDKRTQLQAFVDFCRSCHFTCLFSHAEAFGLSSRESLRLGVPVLANDVGGIPDSVPEGCGHLFPREADAGDIANTIETYVRDPDRYWALRDAIAQRSLEFTWAAAVEKLRAIWSGSDAYLHQA